MNWSSIQVRMYTTRMNSALKKTLLQATNKSPCYFFGIQKRKKYLAVFKYKNHHKLQKRKNAIEFLYCRVQHSASLSVDIIFCFTHQKAISSIYFYTVRRVFGFGGKSWQSRKNIKISLEFWEKITFVMCLILWHYIRDKM